MTSSFGSSQAASSTTTYYEVLEISPTASPLDIKKAYRRLALQYHPDRNSDPTAKQRFQQIGQAYACLSDPIQRRDYDRQLEQDQPQNQHTSADFTYTSSSPSFSTSTQQYNSSKHHHHRYPFRNPVVVDPWTQFDFLFHNDPFFRDYFESPERVQQELEELKRAATTIPSTNPASSPRNNRSAHSRNSSSSSTSRMQQQEGWIPWLLRQCGIQFTMTTIVQDGNGRIHAKQVSSTPTARTNHSHYHDSRSSGARHQVSPFLSSSSSAKSTTTTIQQETVSYMENGQRVWIKKRQLQGTLIEDKIVGSTLVERKVNGVSVPLQQQ